MKIDIITVFPEMFSGPFEQSIVQRARNAGLVEINLHDLREFTLDKHRQVDDYPFGGGAGMVLKPEPLVRAIETVKGDSDATVLLTAANGESFRQETAHQLKSVSHMIIICGHYKGVDQRVIDGWVDMEISIGEYILTGGELPAMIMVDAVVRLLPGALGDTASAETDSFEDGQLEEALYTRPAEFRNLKVPDILLSGHHANIAKWRAEQRSVKTMTRKKNEKQ